MKIYLCDLCGETLDQKEPRDNLFIVLSKDDIGHLKIWRDMCQVCANSVKSKLKEMLKVDEE